MNKCWYFKSAFFLFSLWRCGKTWMLLVFSVCSTHDIKGMHLSHSWSVRVVLILDVFVGKLEEKRKSRIKRVGIRGNANERGRSIWRGEGGEVRQREFWLLRVVKNIIQTKVLTTIAQGNQITNSSKPTWKHAIAPVLFTNLTWIWISSK